MADQHDGTPVKHVSQGGRSLGRDDITTGHEEVAVRFYRASHPTIFAGACAQLERRPGLGVITVHPLDLEAGMGSKYATLRVDVPGRPPVYEYVDIAEVIQARVAAIIAEVA